MFGVSSKPGDAKVSYWKCSACDDAVIAAVGRMLDHWAMCKKRPRSIGQLDEVFQPSREVGKVGASVGVGDAFVGECWRNMRTVPEPQNASLVFSGGRQYFYILTKG